MDEGVVRRPVGEIAHALEALLELVCVRGAMEDLAFVVADRDVL